MVSRSHIMIYDSMIIHSFLAFSQHVRYFSHVLLVCSLHLFLSQLSFDAPTLLVARQKLWHDSRDRDSKIKCSRFWFYTYCCQLVWHSIAAVRGVIHPCLTRIASLKWVCFSRNLSSSSEHFDIIGVPVKSWWESLESPLHAEVIKLQKCPPSFVSSGDLKGSHPHSFVFGAIMVQWLWVHSKKTKWKTNIEHAQHD